MNIPAALDAYFPRRGPCAFCGGPDARHRVWDAIRERRAAGESVEDLARDYGVPVEAVGLVLTSGASWTTPTP